MSDNIPSQNSAILFHFLTLALAKADLQLDLTLVPLITMEHSPNIGLFTCN